MKSYFVNSEAHTANQAFAVYGWIVAENRETASALARNYMKRKKWVLDMALKLSGGLVVKDRPERVAIYRCYSSENTWPYFSR